MNPNMTPNDDKQLNPSGKPPLSEKDFIQNGRFWSSQPFWLWFALLVVAACLMWGMRGWYDTFLVQEKKHDPFLEVTNREFSVFLWQFPSFLRRNASNKTGYLPGFSSTSENLNLANAEDFVSAPPDLIFLYHTWKRLLAPEFISRAITPQAFDEFLQQIPEWQPKNWKKAPDEYRQLIDSKIYMQMKNLQELPQTSLPLDVRLAFQGWENYFKEGFNINDVQPTFAQVQKFLEKYPHYARNFWCNIAEINRQPIAGKNYLYGMLNPQFSADTLVPTDQLSSFLKVALFNEQQAMQEK